MMLEKLIKEGVHELDQLLTGMVREGNNHNLGEDMWTLPDGGELNGALVRYLEESTSSLKPH